MSDRISSSISMSAKEPFQDKPAAKCVLITFFLLDIRFYIELDIQVCKGAFFRILFKAFSSSKFFAPPGCDVRYTTDTFQIIFSFILFSRLRRGDFRYTTILYQSTLSKHFIKVFPNIFKTYLSM